MQGTSLQELPQVLSEVVENVAENSMNLAIVKCLQTLPAMH